MSLASRYQVPHSNIIHDTIEGEVILLDLNTGTYYQLRDTSVPVWNALAQGISLDEIVAQFAQRFPNDRAQIQASIAQFIQELEQEGLLAPLAEDAPAPTAATEMDVAAHSNTAFHAPTLLKYTDMQALLLLDPIHDVDAHGWPLTNPQGSQ